MKTTKNKLTSQESVEESIEESITTIGKDAMWWGKLSEFYQKSGYKEEQKNEYYHSKFIKGQEVYQRSRKIF